LAPGSFLCTLVVVAAPDLQQIAIQCRDKVQEFQRSHRVAVLTLVFTDIVGSTKLKQELGDQEAVSAIQRHHAAIREILSRFGQGEEVETAGDSFFIVFTNPSDAVKFSLFAQARLRALAAETARPLFDRIGIHVGEVLVEEDDNRGKAEALYGIQVDTCARVQSLAAGDQILLTRFAFDESRRSLSFGALDGIDPLSWLNHGPYLLKGVEEPIDICEVGELGKAKLGRPPDTEKAHRFISADSEPVLGWRPAVDQPVPGTSWVLEKKLGEGGFGEVWLGRDKRLKTEHVFKFCFRADRVRSLKREVTLFRLLKERVGEHPNIVGIEHVYFDEAPFYIVMQHVEGEDLATWCEAQGGVDMVPLSARLGIVAQVAAALQAAHDSGVIHRDVKPSNILVGRRSDIHAYLTDFGIGQVVSEEVLSRLTRSGFTQTIEESSSRSGTQLYMAPELFSGKPASIRSDIYALGVVLYQLVVGDFSSAVTTDWAKRIADPLLREDLEKCFAGDPQERFAGAGQLAEQLRSLEARRAASDQQQALLKERERAAYRRGIIRTAALALVVMALVTGLAIYAFLKRHEAQEQTKEASAQRTAAQEQARIAETRRLAAQVSEKKANDARDQADGLIDFMLYDLRDKLEPIGRLDVLDDVAKKAKEYFDRLPKELVTGPRLEEQIGMLINLGDVLVAQGKLQDALDLYEQSLAIAKGMAKQDKYKSDPDIQRDFSVIYDKLGDVLLAQSKLQDALDAYQQGLTITKQLAEQDKSKAAWQRDVSLSYERLGNVLLTQGKLPEALDAHQQSLVIAKRLAEQDKSNAGWQRDLSASYDGVGDVLLVQGKLPEALDVYQQSLRNMQTLAGQDKSNSDWQRELAVSYERVGDVLEAQGKLPEALDAYQQSLKILQTLAEQDKSNTGWQRELAVGDEKVGDVLRSQGNLQGALDLYQQGLAIAKRLAEQDKSNAGWQRDLSVSYEMVGYLLETQHKLSEALDAYQQSLKIRQTLAEQRKSNVGAQRDLSMSYERVGYVLRVQGKLEDALDAYRQSLKIVQTQAEQDRFNTGWQRELAVSYERVGELLVAQGKVPEALDAYQQSLKILQTLAEQDKSNPDWQRELAVSYEKVGDVLRTQGKLEEALELYQQGLAISKRLADQDGSNAGWQRDLSLGYEMVGYLRETQGKLPEALDAYQQSLKIRQTLVEKDKTNSIWQRDLIVSLYEVGRTTARIGRKDSVLQAQGILQTALNLAERYPGSDRQNLIDALNLALRNLVH
jgi:tetratricopeptide (TPR) repeat protein/class 3 adenylate cyclase/tRNA A-37 threonylcarbamoyl transferase component Bud32